MGSKVIQYRVKAREKGHFCMGSKVIQYSVKAREKGTFVWDQK